MSPVRVLSIVAGSRFALQLEQVASFFNDGAVDAPDLTGYMAKLQLLHGKDVLYELDGTWLSAVTPFKLNFNQLSTKLWMPRAYSLRMSLLEPNAPVGADPYLKMLGMTLEVE